MMTTRCDEIMFICDVQSSITAFGGKGGGSAPAAPDYTPIAEANAEAADRYFELGEDQLNWSRDQFDVMWPYARDYLDQSTASSADETDRALRYDKMYQDVYEPIERDLAQSATDWYSPGRAEADAGRAMADVSTQFETARKSALSSLESYGIDPSQTRYGALDLSSRINQAAATAAAGTQSRIDTEKTGLGLMAAATDVGRGYPGAISAAYGSSVNTGSSGLKGATSLYEGGSSSMGTPNSYFGSANTALANQAGALNYGYNNALGGAQLSNNISANQSSGLGNIVGGALSLGAKLI